MEKKIKLRAIKNADVGLMEIWLQKEHVKPWFSSPWDWINEIKNRRKQFSFIKHFIIEYKEEPVGFCQYYDLTKSGEEEYGSISKGDYSIDYLIGDEKYLGKGIAKAAIRILLNKLMFKEDCVRVLVNPDKENIASGKLLESLGFGYDDESGLYKLLPGEIVRYSAWNLWRGCSKYSEGCENCYIYSRDFKNGVYSIAAVKTAMFDYPVRRNKQGEYAVRSGTVFWTCFSSDFLHEQCDGLRAEAWDMIRERKDCSFIFITKRIERFLKCVPMDWGDGYENVVVGVTCENQKRADERLPHFKSLPIKHKFIVISPMLERMDISRYLGADIEQVTAGGESGAAARACDYDWILNIREQCMLADVTFVYKQTGSKLLKDGVLHNINWHGQHAQARKAGINFEGRRKSYLPESE